MPTEENPDIQCVHVLEEAENIMSSKPKHLDIDQFPDCPISPSNIARFEDPKQSADCQKPKKKRIRRERVELDYLRRESRKLQAELVQLQRAYRQRHGRTSQLREPGSRPMFGNRQIVPRIKETEFVWQGIAERQLKERLRVQSRNRELREQLEAECELEKRMTTLLCHKNTKVSDSNHFEANSTHLTHPCCLHLLRYVAI